MGSDKAYKKVVGKVMNEEPIGPGEGLLHHDEGADLMPANIALSSMEISLVNAMSREKILKQYLDGVKRQLSVAAGNPVPASKAGSHRFFPA